MLEGDPIGDLTLVICHTLSGHKPYLFESLLRFPPTLSERTLKRAMACSISGHVDVGADLSGKRAYSGLNAVETALRGKLQ